MATKKDMRRADLIVPYQAPAPKADGADIQSTISSTLPMAAIFMRNRFIGWAAVVFSLQSWLGESEESKNNSATPGYFGVGMSLMSLVVCYLPMFLPPQAGGLNRGATGTNAPPPVPPS
ncbi:hypothetical protein MCOR25_007741 [Pyricularia grisea]|uniref:Uncharacterized protein n=1 Tax=Pyricularia grisea TaxID=148305 RepID=A0A6P8AYW2_PYRGI|nr:hypothetical protein PgNI_10527 [Pyricularia grisea]KAI6357098.1 hypothetical protein MCOR25_007741 [Pyricularia grisea]TLD07441.1 hypothetical protein PgNI_10527 [Pyricularia grisea]